MKALVNLAVVIVSIGLAVSCKKETQPAEENENELVTTVQLDFKNRTTNETSTFAWEDEDGPGGNVPTIDDIMLDNNTVYDVQVTLWNKSVAPAENVNEEILAESENHRFYYEVSAGTGININNFDNDINGVPLGINSEWTTGNAGTGTLTVVLRHYAEGGKEGSDLVNDTKSTTDAGAVFNLIVRE